MNISIDDARKEKIWEDLLSSLDISKLQPNEKTIKTLMEEKSITEEQARLIFKKLETAGKVTFRLGKYKEKIYMPVE